MKLVDVKYGALYGLCWPADVPGRTQPSVPPLSEEQVALHKQRMADGMTRTDARTVTQGEADETG